MIDISRGRYWDEGVSLVSGCTKCSSGCDHCWSLAMERRFSKGEKVTVHPDRLKRFNTKKPKVFAVWNDLFHEDVPFTFVRLVWDSISQTVGKNAYLILTKRPQRMLDFAKWLIGADDISIAEWPRNAYLGLTVCNQSEADEKIPIFLQVPGKKFLSIEPMLGAINIERYLRCPVCCYSKADQVIHMDHRLCRGGEIPDLSVILGGESGAGARPLHPDWVRSLRDQCASAGADFFFKQWGEWVHYCQYSFGIGAPCLSSVKVENELYRVGRKHAGRLLDGRTHDELPWIRTPY